MPLPNKAGARRPCSPEGSPARARSRSRSASRTPVYTEDRALREALASLQRALASQQRQLELHQDQLRALQSQIDALNRALTALLAIEALKLLLALVSLFGVCLGRSAPKMAPKIAPKVLEQVLQNLSKNRPRKIHKKCNFGAPKWTQNGSKSG